MQMIMRFVNEDSFTFFFSSLYSFYFLIFLGILRWLGHPG